MMRVVLATVVMAEVVAPFVLSLCLPDVFLEFGAYGYMWHTASLCQLSGLLV